MSSKTRTRKNRTGTTGSTPTLRSVPDQTATTRTDSEDRLWKTLHGNPNSTATDLASAAKIGKSTAGKILAKWHKGGSVTRTPGIVAGGGRRTADLWSITETDAAETAQDEATATESTVTAADGAHAPTDTTAEAESEGEATDSADTGPDSTEATEPAEGATSEDGTETVSGREGKAARLAPGTLRGMVEDYLRDHPGEEFGPTAIAKALGGKSSGAVSNALDKLVADNMAVKTKDKPRRFALAPAEQAAAPAPAN